MTRRLHPATVRGVLIGAGEGIAPGGVGTPKRKATPERAARRARNKAKRRERAKGRK